MIERLFIDVPGPEGARRVHLRCFGKGPPLLMIHQSPRSSIEYEALMARWGADFTCIAPDTPGFGQSDALPGEPDIDDFGRALLDLKRALGLDRCAAYGFHSGAIVLMAAIKQQPDAFTRAAMGGYAVWTPQEMAWFGERYLPPFEYQPYGEHLTWLWNRMLEQSWVFPWFDVRDEARLPGAHDDIARVDAAVMEMLDSGPAYRAGYGAVLRAERAIPDAGPPTLITAYDGDPLQSHIARLGSLPEGWEARAVSTAQEHQDASREWLMRGAAGDSPDFAQSPDEGFASIAGRRVHWIGTGSTLHLHAPGSEARAVPGRIAIDLPGHGLSDDARPDEDWHATIAACERHFGTVNTVADGATAALLGQAPPPCAEAVERLIPDLTPDRFGSHLQRAWSAARAARLFDPWYLASNATRRHFDPSEVAPAAIHRDARALLRARAARLLLAATATGGTIDGNS